jgi:hypothetical protein
VAGRLRDGWRGGGGDQHRNGENDSFRHDGPSR